ncbi:MAG: PD-(D/E)XK nuclease family protein [Elusimicrobiales bacterium]
MTGMLSVINKPALVPWAKREALGMVENALMERLDGRQSARLVINKAWVQAVLEDAKRRPDKLKDEAADLGSQAHAFIDLIIHGKEPESLPAAIEGPVKAFKDWWGKMGIQLVMGDTKVASTQYGYGGSLDALGVRNGKLVLLDWKTSSGIYDEYALQVAAYAQAFKETFGADCAEAFIVRFGKKLPIEFEAKEVASLQESFAAFLAAKTLKESLAKPHFVEW